MRGFVILAGLMFMGATLGARPVEGQQLIDPLDPCYDVVINEWLMLPVPLAVAWGDTTTLQNLVVTAKQKVGLVAFALANPPTNPTAQQMEAYERLVAEIRDCLPKLESAVDKIYIRLQELRVDIIVDASGRKPERWEREHHRRELLREIRECQKDALALLEKWGVK